MKRIHIITIAFVLGIVLVPLSVAAKDGQPSTVKPPEPTTTKSSEPQLPHPELGTSGKKADTTTTTPSTDGTEVKRERLSTDKLKTCEERQTQVNEIMARILTRTKANFTRITTAAERAEAFYTQQGNVLSNYDALLATVTSTKAAAQAAIDTLSSTSTFSCTSDAPKADIQDFRTHRESKVTAMTAYRDAVKALIKGIKSVQPTDTTTTQATTEVKQ
jgi:hypothetical protein